MDKLKRYINVHVALSNCTLRCHYCYVTLHQTFGHPIPKLERDPRFIRQALSKERLGGCCHLNFCADGETLLLPGLTDVVEQLLLEGHYISIVSNCTLNNRIDELVALPEKLRKHIFVKASYHYLELKRIGLLDSFFDNVRKLHDANISLTIEITPSDELIPYADEAVNLCSEKMGAAPHFTIARDEHNDHLPILTDLSLDEYHHVWGKYDSVMFDYKKCIYGRPIKKFCYAGEWFLCLDLLSGDISQCYGTQRFQNIYSNINEPIHFKPIGSRCPRAHCFNGHALLTQGVVPGEKSPTYAATRDRIMADGEHWLYSDVMSFFSQRLYDNNPQYPWYKKIYINHKALFKPIKRVLLNLLGKWAH